MKKQYDTFAEFINDIPPKALFAKRKLQVYSRERDKVHDEIYFLYYSEPDEVSINETAVFIKEKGSEKIWHMDKKKLEKELAEILADFIDPKAVANDLVKDLSCLDLIDTYDRAVVKKGKIQADTKIGVFNLKVFGYKKPKRILVGRQ